MSKLLRLISSFLSFGILPLVRWLVKKKLVRSHYSIDIDRDGLDDVTIQINGRKENNNAKTETESEE